MSLRVHREGQRLTCKTQRERERRKNTLDSTWSPSITVHMLYVALQTLLNFCSNKNNLSWFYRRCVFSGCRLQPAPCTCSDVHAHLQFQLTTVFVKQSSLILAQRLWCKPQRGLRSTRRHVANLTWQWWLNVISLLRSMGRQLWLLMLLDFPPHSWTWGQIVIGNILSIIKAALIQYDIMYWCGSVLCISLIYLFILDRRTGHTFFTVSQMHRGHTCFTVSNR